MTISRIRSVILQPTTFCNLNCTYCYLPHRDERRVMPVAVASAVASALGSSALIEPINVVWHGGEPLSVGCEHLEHLVGAFDDLSSRGLVHHAVQTNATLVNQRWCEFFRRSRISVGVSVDGPSWANRHRVGRGGDPSFRRAMHGISCLKEADIDFSVICVITDELLDHAATLYSFFADLGCHRVAFNIVEKDGVNRDSPPDPKRAVSFWRELWNAWWTNPRLEIREFSRVLDWMDGILQRSAPSIDLTVDPFPTVGASGDVVLLSPEFLGIQSRRYSNFVVGNVLVDELTEIVSRATSHRYVDDFLAGVAMCREECEYFSYCRGGQASNKFFELNSLRTTETEFCRSSRIAPVDAVMFGLERGSINDTVGTSVALASEAGNACESPRINPSEIPHGLANK
jgi:uncharacterized protein